MQFDGEQNGLSCKKKEWAENVGKHGAHVSHVQMSPVEVRINANHVANRKMIDSPPMINGAGPYVLEKQRHEDSKTYKNIVLDLNKADLVDKKPFSDEVVSEVLTKKTATSENAELRERLAQVYDQVLVVDTITAARQVVYMLTHEYKDLIHACDTEACNVFL